MAGVGRPELARDGTGEAVVLFSGGSDSTLTASLLSESHPRVHLVTYAHRAMRFEDKCLNSLRRLREAHGEDRFVHSFRSIDGLMGRLFFGALAGDIRRYGTYALPMCCGACKLSMHVSTIQYCREHGIRHAADGSNAELSNLFPEQMVAVLEQYRRLYARYGIEFTTPVFDIDRSDHRLFERGVTPKRDYKTEHVLYSNQHSCAAGSVLYAFTLGVALPLLGRSARPEIAERVIADKIRGVCIPLLDGGEPSRATV